MINCPNCGSPVTAGQRFCGVCSYDLQSAAPATMPSEDQSSPYAYSQSPYGYYDTQPLEQPAGGGRMIVIALVFVLAICFAFACGVLVGDTLPTILSPKPTTAPRPTPSSLLEIVLYWIA